MTPTIPEMVKATMGLRSPSMSLTMFSGERAMVVSASSPSVILAPGQSRSCQSLAIRRASFEENLDNKLANSTIESAEEVLRNAAKAAAEKIVEEIDNQNVSVALKASAEVLDRVGVVKQGGSINANQTTVVIDAKIANVIQESLKMEGEGS